MFVVSAEPPKDSQGQRLSEEMKTLIAIALATALALPAHAAEKADDDAFILGCIWTGDSKGTVCGGFPTRALCEREGRAAVASGELLSFNCDSVAGPSAPAQPTWPPGQGNSLGGQEAGGIGNVLSMLDHVMGGLFGGGSPTKYGDPRAVQPTFAQRPQPPVARPGGFFDYLGGGGQIAGLDALQHPPGASCVDLRDDSHKVTVHGTIEQSTTTEEGEGGTPPGRKYMSIVLDQPSCAANDEKSIAVDPVSVKWLGHHVAITGTVEPTGDGAYIAVQRIKDSALAVPSRAADKANDDAAFLLACVWTGHHKADACGGFPTRALCEREGHIAVASGEITNFDCISVIDDLFKNAARWWPG